MPVRKASEPPIIGSAPPVPDTSAEAFVTVVDGDTAPGRYFVGDQVELKAAFTTRALGVQEVRTFRKEGVLPDSIGVSPAEVYCAVQRPRTEVEPAVQALGGGVFAAIVEVRGPGECVYTFSGRGGFHGTGSGRFTAERRAG